MLSKHGYKIELDRGPMCHVRFGSKADMCGAPTHVRFSPESDRISGHLAPS